MKAQLPNALARALRDFFADHLPRLRGMSPHTVQSYRDTFTLFLRFLSSHQGRDVAVLDFENIGAQEVIAFLQHLEDTRKNTSATRNVRLAAIHAFFRYLAGRHPERLEQCQRILGVPFKRSRTQPVEYLEYAEIQAVVDAADRGTPDGRRDYALLVTMFNTGARVQEAIDLRPCDLQLIKPFQVRLFGKGRKERLCPLWPETAEVLKDFLSERRVDPHSREALFRNHRGEPLTRFGVRYLLAKYCDRARVIAPTLAKKRLHPHSMRHYVESRTMSGKTGFHRESSHFPAYKLDIVPVSSSGCDFTRREASVNTTGIHFGGQSPIRPPIHAKKLIVAAQPMTGT